MPGTYRKTLLRPIPPSICLFPPQQESCHRSFLPHAEAVPNPASQPTVAQRFLRFINRGEIVTYGGVALLPLGQQRARARAAVAAQVTALYYRRRAAPGDLRWAPPPTALATARRELTVEELSAQLDALTGGWWSRQLDP